jgi:hypothetical protein
MMLLTCQPVELLNQGWNLSAQRYELAPNIAFLIDRYTFFEMHMQHMYLGLSFRASYGTVV